MSARDPPNLKLQNRQQKVVVILRYYLRQQALLSVVFVSVFVCSLVLGPFVCSLVLGPNISKTFGLWREARFLWTTNKKWDMAIMANRMVT